MDIVRTIHMLLNAPSVTTATGTTTNPFYRAPRPFFPPIVDDWNSPEDEVYDK